MSSSRKCLKCKHCKTTGAAYAGYIGKSTLNNHFYCDYLEDTGHKRPCKAGDACTVFEPKERKRKKKDAKNNM